MSATMTYNELYTKMVSKFTIEKNDRDYKLGEYMLAKAQKRKATALVSKAEAKENLPMPVSASESRLTALISYVQEKLTVKEAPIKNKTIRKFPIRSSLTAFGSAMVVCSLVIVSAFFGLKAMPDASGNESYIAQENDTDTQDKNETASANYEIKS